MATTAAILDVLLKADTNQAVGAMRQFDSTLDRSARTARTAGRTTEQLTRTNARLGTSYSRTGSFARTAGRDHDRFNRTTSKLGSTLKTAAGAAAGAAAAYVSISQVKAAVDRSQDLFAATMNLKKSFGLSAKAASGFNAVVLSKGGEVSATAGAFRTLGKNIEEAGKGTESAVKAFQAFGITQKELQTLSKDQLLFEISDGMAELNDKTRESAAANVLFGKTAAKEVIPSLRGGSAALKEQIALAEEAGATFSDSGDIKNMTQLTATQRELEIRTLGLQVQLTKHLVPALIAVVKWVDNAVKATKAWLEKDDHLKNFIKGFLLIPKIWVKIVKGLIDAKNKFNEFGRFVRDMFGKVASFIGDKVKKIVGFFTSMPRKIKDAFADVGEGIKDKFNDVLDFFAGWVNSVIRILNNIPGVEIGYIDTGGGPSAQKKQQKKKGGGRQSGGPAWKVPGYGSGDKVHMQAMVEPGEGVFVMNRNAMGALEAMNKSVPRFAGGGAIPHLISGGDIVGGVGEFLGKTPAGKVIRGAGDLIGELPSPGDLPDWLQGMGSYVIDKAKDYIKDKIAALVPSAGAAGGPSGTTSWMGVTMAKWVAKSLQHAASKGVKPQPTSGYRSHAYNVSQGRNYFSEHEGLRYPHGAVDFGGYTTGLASKMAVVGATSDFRWPLLAPIGFSDDGHASGTGHARGGPVKGRGARFVQGGGHWTASEAATLLYQVGASASQARLLSRKVAGESSGNPNARGHDPGGTTGLGLWQITTGYNDDLIRRYSPIMDPVNNAKAALAILRRQGIGAWYAGSSAPGSIMDRWLLSGEELLEQKQGPFKTQRDAVNYLMNRGVDKQLAQSTAIRWMNQNPFGGTGGGGKGKKKKKPAAGGGAAAATDDTGADRLAAINELIGEQNLLKLGNYQLGRAQHPMLGLANPAAPGLTSAWTSLPTAATASVLAGATKPSVNSKAKVGKHKASSHLGATPKVVGKHKASSTLHPVILIEDGAVNANRIRSLSGKEAKRAMKRAARRGNRGLPSGGGRGP